MTSAAPLAQRLLPETAERTAKADLRKPEKRDFRSAIGSAIDRARLMLGWSIKELAAVIGRDESQLRKWISGAERPQFDVLFAVPELQQPLVITLAALAETGVEIETVVRVRRRELVRTA